MNVFWIRVAHCIFFYQSALFILKYLLKTEYWFDYDEDNDDNGDADDKLLLLLLLLDKCNKDLWKNPSLAHKGKFEVDKQKRKMVSLFQRRIYLIYPCKI